MVSELNDMTWFHNYDEADFLIPQQVDSIVAEGKKVIKVISADTDVFVLLCSLF